MNYRNTENLMLNISMCLKVPVIYILANREFHRKWDAKCDTGFFLGYSHNSHVYKVFNNRTKIVMETINVVVNDNEKPLLKKMDDKEKLLFQQYVATVSPKQSVTVVPSVDNGIINSDNSSSSTQKEVISNV